jgi:hypothetical protein
MSLSARKSRSFNFQAAIFNAKMRPPCIAVVLAVVSLHLVVKTSGQSIESFEDSSCLTPAKTMAPSKITFDAAKPECLLIRDDTTLTPLVGSFDVDFYATAENCLAGVPIVVNYSNSYFPVTPMPIFPSPVSNRNMSFCYEQSWSDSGSSGVFMMNPTTTSRKLTMAVREVPGARFSMGLAGRYAQRLLCSLNPNSTVFSVPPNVPPNSYYPQQGDNPIVMKYKSFIQYQGPTIKYGLQMFLYVSYF